MIEFILKAALELIKALENAGAEEELMSLQEEASKARARAKFGKKV